MFTRLHHHHLNLTKNDRVQLTVTSELLVYHGVYLIPFLRNSDKMLQKNDSPNDASSQSSVYLERSWQMVSQGVCFHQNGGKSAPNPQ